MLKILVLTIVVIVYSCITAILLLAIIDEILTAIENNRRQKNGEDNADKA